MIIFFYGRDSYRLKQNLDKITQGYKEKNASGMSFALLDLSQNSDLDKLEDLIKTVSFFGEKRLVVLRGAFAAGEKLADLIQKWDLATDKERIVVISEESDQAELNKKNKKLFALLAAEPNMVKEFQPLEARKLENWLVKEIRNEGYEIDGPGLKKLIECTADQSQKEPDSSNTWRLKQEINKLTNYKLSQKSKLITAQDVELLVAPRVNLNIFQVIDAIASKSKPQAIALLHKRLEDGEDPHYIYSMIVYQWRNLLRVKSLAQDAMPIPEITKKTGLNPFVVRKSYEQSRKYDLDDLKRSFASLARLEIESKNGLIDLADGLYRFVFAL